MFVSPRKLPINKEVSQSIKRKLYRNVPLHMHCPQSPMPGYLCQRPQKDWEPSTKTTKSGVPELPEYSSLCLRNTMQDSDKLREDQVVSRAVPSSQSSACPKIRTALIAGQREGAHQQQAVYRGRPSKVARTNQDTQVCGPDLP